MHHAAFVAKSMLGLSEKTVEEGYEERRMFMKQFGEITEAVVSATTRVSQSLHNLSAVLMDAQNKLEILAKMTVKPCENAVSDTKQLQSSFNNTTDSQRRHSSSRTVSEDGGPEGNPLEQEEGEDALTFYCREFGEQLHAWRTTRIGETQIQLESEVADPFREIMEAMREVETLRQGRIRALQSYDIARSEVQQKEVEYGKKGKPVTESKMYPKLVERSDLAKAEFEDRTLEFNAACDELMDRGHCTTAQAFQALLHRTSEVLTEFVQLLNGVLESTGGL